jgi:hypothetical protein
MKFSALSPSFRNTKNVRALETSLSNEKMSDFFWRILVLLFLQKQKWPPISEQPFFVFELHA